MLNGNFTGDGKEFTKDFWVLGKFRKLFILTIDWNWENAVKTHHGIIERQHPSSETNDIADRAILRTREGSSAVMLKSDFNEKYDWFYEILLFSAKCPSLFDRWRRISQDVFDLKRVFLKHFSDMHCSWKEFGRDLLSMQTLRSREIWTRQKSLLEGSS